MLFIYKAITKEGREVEGDIEALGEDIAVASLQKKGLIVISVSSADKKRIFEHDIAIFNRVSAKEIAILSRQMATLLEAHVPALRSFHLLASESENPTIRTKFIAIADDIQNGVAISDALYKYPSIFSDFYVNMVRAGEESGKLPETFTALADHLERNYELMSKARGALIYPAFIVATFIIVMILMFVLVIPKLTGIIQESGQEVPFYTQIVISISELLINYGLLMLLSIITLGFVLWQYSRGTTFVAKAKLWIPGVGNLYRMIYLSRIADNMHTMLDNGITMVRGIEITEKIVGNDIYEEILNKVGIAVKGGAPLSLALSNYPEIPNVMIQMIKVGEETGELGNILGKLSAFYQREVNNAIGTIISMIEPAMIVGLGIGVGGVLVSVLMPIYQIAGGI
ncbi:MAG: type II secretion system F family protein [Patescibacteria group bacterium]